jgi:RNA polymerase sigma-70 factor (ECF subfamily)
VARYSSISAEELIRACAVSKDEACWDEFVFRFHKPISLSILRTASQWGNVSRDLIDDLVQETFTKISTESCHLLNEFAQRSPEAIVGYIKTVAVNIARDYFKSVYSQKRGAGRIDQHIEETEAAAPPSRAGGQAAIERHILLTQINQCLLESSEGPDHERDCLIFWLYYQQGMSAKAIAALPGLGLTAKGVESAIFRLTRLVRDRIVRPHAQSVTGEERPKGFRPAESY